MGAPVSCELLPNGRCFLSDGIHKQVALEGQAVRGAIRLTAVQVGKLQAYSNCSKASAQRMQSPYA